MITSTSCCSTSTETMRSSPMDLLAHATFSSRCHDGYDAPGRHKCHVPARQWCLIYCYTTLGIQRQVDSDESRVRTTLYSSVNQNRLHSLKIFCDIPWTQYADRMVSAAREHNNYYTLLMSVRKYDDEWNSKSPISCRRPATAAERTDEDWPSKTD